MKRQIHYFEYPAQKRLRSDSLETQPPSSDSDSEYEVKCCMCTQDGVYEDLQQAYDCGWFQHEFCDYCPEHAEQGILQADHGEIYTIVNTIVQEIISI